MQTEDELRELHHRLVKVLAFAQKMRIRGQDLRDLQTAKLALEWILGMETNNGKAWAAVLFKGVNNLEGLRDTYERTQKAAQN